ncbi:T9SS type A sorting domain-containing protein [Fulvivirga sediminis]|uniref:T9SS type A sorting domain-containing protein n=1 Tax=Fulvivirga sediminis TaxID=2803949 RepID=A0A937FEJ4_9BACT|nr:T9SS type A sorting domain-containing protein [Fulvivirga sediminis]MBL3659068.1 T9SS type A sorting domain-containing protein [Fulvivirga sediminis]
MKHYLPIFFLSKLIFFSCLLNVSVSRGQERKCFSYEYEKQLRNKYPHLKTLEEYESVINYYSKKQGNSLIYREAGDVFTIPVIFHVIHSGESVGSGDNISAALINAQIEQLNNDYRKKEGTLGYNNNPVGADLLVEFVPALIGPDGQILSEAGINRINREDMGWSSPPFGVCNGFGTLDNTYIEEVVKPESFWDSDKYLNIWVMDISCGVLGYAQFPSFTELPGLEDDEGIASTDGVVLLTSSVGGENLPNPMGGDFNMGRTATHEVGHWLGLRHIWGDGGCGVDDYCDDTPAADQPNYGCAPHTACGSMDMIENYMDYTDDACMNIFTQDQKTRIDIALLNSPRRSQLEFSTVHLCAFPYLFISEIVDGTEAGDLPRYVELYNSGTESYDLSGVSLRIYFNGSTEHNVSIDIPEGTTIDPEGTFVFSKTEFTGIWGNNFDGVTPDLIDANLNADGNDVYELFDNKLNVPIDIFGDIGTDGNSEAWNYENARAVRRNYVLTANVGTFRIIDWAIAAYDSDISDPGYHLAEIPSFDASISGLSGIENGITYFACAGEVIVSPIVEIKNVGTESFSTINLLINQNGNVISVIVDIGLLEPGENVAINLPEITHELEGEFSYSVSIDEEDGNPTNDNNTEVSYGVNIFENTTALKVITQTDRYPEEISWSIQDSNGDVIFFNNTFSASSLDISNICIEDGDYKFVLYDSYGDGIGDGYCSLVTADNDIIATIPGDHPNFDAILEEDPDSVSFNFSIPLGGSYDASLVIIKPELGDNVISCTPYVDVLGVIENTGNMPISSLTYEVANEEYSIDGFLLEQGESANIKLGAVSLEEGENLITASLVQLNGRRDMDPGNSTPEVSVYYTDDPTNTQFRIELNLDFYPEETSWRVEDSEGNILKESIAYNSGNLTVNSFMCLNDGCYIFKLLDRYGDGGPTANLYLNDELIDSLGYEPWTDQLKTEFCVTAPKAVESFEAIASDNLTIQLSWHDEDEGVLYYHLEKSTDQISWEDLSENITLESRSYLDKNLERDIKYYYKISKAYLAGNSDWKIASATANLVTGTVGQYGVEKMGLSIYPNPTKDKINISFNENLKNPVVIQVLDNMGKIIQENYASKHNDHVEISLDNIPRGAYLITVKSSEAVLIKKILKD